MSRTDERPVVKNSIEVRQGVTGHHVRWVLVVGIVVAVVVLAVALWLNVPR